MGMVSFIRVAWILATFPVAVACFPLPGLGWFRTALLGIAKRGKILQSKSVSETCAISNNSNKLYSHSYIFISDISLFMNFRT